MQYIVAYLAAAAFFLAVDALWLGVVARDFYVRQMGDLLLDRPNLAVAAGFYLVYCVGIVIFAISPALTAQNWTTALLYGALFGFFAYATYDMTNLAVMKGFPVTAAVVDIAWGTALTAAAAVAGYLAVRHLVQ